MRACYTTLVLAAVLAGCQSECKLGVIGDTSSPPTLELIALGNDQKTINVTDHGTVPIYLPPQGGRVIMIGVRARNLIACGAQLTGSLRDSSTGQRRLDSRTINLVANEDGSGGTVDGDISTYANIPVCPNQWAQGSVFDSEYTLTVSVVDQAQRTATATIAVVPTCVGGSPAIEAECRCLCKAGYVLGEDCSAGTDGGTP